MSEFKGAEFTGAEFTGERVIPELVDADLLNEHLARYRFARHFIGSWGHPLNVLDAGCGSGYGTAALTDAGIAVTGTDISAEAVEHAQQRYGETGASFQIAPCEALPFGEATFDLVTAFEVIEHLDRWQELLAEANRVLKSSGVLLVSTPNRDYYAESRGEAGPNPFHRHEFDYEEFRQSLGAVFPHVQIWTQNHAEAIVFSLQESSGTALDGTALEAGAANDPTGAHFYLAACSRSPIAAKKDVFAWVPSSANVLRERERHIAKLAGELEQKDVWLKQALAAHAELQSNHEAVTAELERQNNWAAELNREITLKNSRISDLQTEVEGRLVWVADLESQIAGAVVEIQRLRAEMGVQTEEAQAAIDRLEARVIERTLWAERLNGELQRIGASQWFRTGAKLGLGPRLHDGQSRDDQLHDGQSRDNQ